MTEDELLAGITEAMTYGGWIWQHPRRSDAALMMGDTGHPDIIAIHPERGIQLAWELKTERGAPTSEQLRWIGAYMRVRHTDTRIVRPRDYDSAVAAILAPRRVNPIEEVASWCIADGCFAPPARMLDTYRGLCAAHG